MSTYSPSAAVMTIAKREFTHALTSKGMILTIVLTAVALCSGIFLFAHFDTQDGGKTIAVSGFEPANEYLQSYTPTGVAGFDEAKQMVADGDAAVAVVKDGETFEVIRDGLLTPELNSMISLMIMGENFNKLYDQALASGVHIDPGAFMADINDVNVAGDSNDNSQNPNFNDVMVTLFGISILIMAILLFAATIGGRVTEEKSSRVVEILLATVRPIDLLAGKILGNIAFGMLATLVLLLLATGSLHASGLFASLELDPSILPVMFVAFVIGMVFFGVLYAAAGALVQRTEDLQSTQAPIMLLLFATLYTPSIFVSKVDTWWMQMFAWLPPLSIGNAPLQYASGNMSMFQFGASMAVMVLFTAMTVFYVAEIYKFAILNNGAKLTWGKAFRRASALATTPAPGAGPSAS
ncbi:ABC transporter permease [Corynebacterium glucuronolyticum]|uniref:ABC transporter permease n=1 Tax=Corynebacterium glucuronolyticum TaxID=39791 RepID=UPI00191E1EE2|nr:ABC transporter permease [Corynebacterium glucuronolyticum]QQU88453.1 ABC transporter permease [Corynebacterium glucuronolyticum]